MPEDVWFESYPLTATIAGNSSFGLKGLPLYPHSQDEAHHPPQDEHAGHPANQQHDKPKPLALFFSKRHRVRATPCP